MNGHATFQEFSNPLVNVKLNLQLRRTSNVLGNVTVNIDPFPCSLWTVISAPEAQLIAAVT